jgi:hypothetical protein
MANVIVKIPLNRLTPHPDNPNRMSKVTFEKLVRNIERTGRYEPLVVRPNKSVAEPNNEQRTMDKEQNFQIINGHHRYEALKRLGYKAADAVIWDVDDDETALLLATLNRLCGRDVLDKKLALLKRLSDRAKPAELAKLLPQTKKQIEKLNQLASSDCLMSIERCKSKIENRQSQMFLNPLVFFVKFRQQQMVEKAIEYALQSDKPAGGRQPEYLAPGFTGGFSFSDTPAPQARQTSQPKAKPTKAEKRAAALAHICWYYVTGKRATKARNELEQFFSEKLQTTTNNEL